MAHEGLTFVTTKDGKRSATLIRDALVGLICLFDELHNGKYFGMRMPIDDGTKVNYEHVALTINEWSELVNNVKHTLTQEKIDLSTAMHGFSN